MKTKKRMNDETGAVKVKNASITQRCRALSSSSFILHPSSFRPSFRPPSRPGISLTEVLISMGILLIGLLGVAAMFPVGTHYVVQGDRIDGATTVGQVAAADMTARGYLRPEAWSRYRQETPIPFSTPPFYTPTFPAVAIDPIGVAAAASGLTGEDRLNAMNFFPSPPPGVSYPAGNDLQWPGGGVSPIARVSIPDNFNSRMSRQVAEMAFSSHDDLSFDLPDQGDKASSLLFEGYDDDNDQSTPDKALRRQWKGNYSWLVTIGPAYDEFGFIATGNPKLRHDVSVVVFHKRDLTFPTSGATEYNEREVEAEILMPSFGGGEVRLFSTDANELKGIRQGEWLMLYGLDPNAPQRWFIQWYQIIATDGELDSGQIERYVTLKGPDWPWDPSKHDVSPGNDTYHIRAGLFRGAIAVYSRSMRLETDSPWSMP